MKKIVLSWSSGKDSAWALHVLRQDPNIEVVSLLTTFTQDYGRVSMHGVRESLVEMQANAASLPLRKINIPAVCSNAIYEEKMFEALTQAKKDGAVGVAFGDLFLQDLRDYRVQKLATAGLDAFFPLWGIPTASLARTMLTNNLKAIVTCVDVKILSSGFSGKEFSEPFLDSLPETVDPCGENGEFHTFCYSGPMFSKEIKLSVGSQVTRDGFCFTDVA